MTETPQSSSGQSRDEIRARLEEIYANDPAVREHGITLGEAAEGHARGVHHDPVLLVVFGDVGFHLETP